MNRWIIITVSMAALVAPSPTFGNNWTGAGSDNLWTNPDNWLQTTTVWVGGVQMPGPDVSMVPPNSTTHPYSGWDDPGGLFYPLTPDLSDDLVAGINDGMFANEGTTALIDASVTNATAYGVRLGNFGSSNTLEMTGGHLQIGGVPPGESEVVGWHLQIGRGFNQTGSPDPIGRMIMTGGVVETNGLLIPEGFVDPDLTEPYDTPGINGELLMSGGTITGRWMNVGQFTSDGNTELSGDAVINLWPNVSSNPNNGGHLSLKRDWFIGGQPVTTVSDARLDIRDDAVINIFGNVSELAMTPNSAEVARYQQYIEDEWLTANNGTAEPIVTLQPCPTDGTFDDYCLSGMMITITAPAVITFGDFNGDDNWDCDDINALTAAIAAGSTDLTFDMNGDNAVTLADITDANVGWLAVGGAQNSAMTGGNAFLVGDATLDGTVDGLDFIEWNNHKFTLSDAWCNGDFTADGTVDGLDFIEWNNHKFTSSTGNPVAVPEPGGILLLIFAGLMACLGRRRFDPSNSCRSALAKPGLRIGNWLLIACISAAVPILPASANDWTGDGTNNLWNNADNWLQRTTMWVGGQQIPGPDVFLVPPDATTHPNFGWDDPGGLFYPLTPDTSDDFPVFINDAKFVTEGTTTLIDASVTDATAYGVRIGLNGASNTLEMTGGHLQIGGIPPGETDIVGWHLDVGRGYNQTTNPDPIARFVMTGGVVDTNLIKVPEGFVDESLADPYDTPGLNGELLMSGGTITGRKLNFGQFTGNGYGELSGDAVINLWPSVASNPFNAGHFEMKQDWFIGGQPFATDAEAHLDIRDDAVINIFGNIAELAMTPDSAEVARYQQYVDDGWLTANNGADEAVITLQPCPTDGTFDDYCLSGMMITITAPEVTTLGDFNGDNSWDCDDIDALTAAIATGSTDIAFDMNGDNAVTLADITDTEVGWLAVGGAQNPAMTGGNAFLVGDATLDGTVDGLDFIEWNENKFTAVAAWCSGDLNADGIVDGLDFISWNNNKFTSSMTDGAAVPEPSAWYLLLCAATPIWLLRAPWSSTIGPQRLQ